MKSNYLTIIFLVLFHSSYAQIVDIPDANFKDALLFSNCVDTNNDGIPDRDADTNDDGEIQLSEAEAVLDLYVNQRQISSMEGIQSFINIEMLDCSTNLFTEIDLSQNTSLLVLQTYYNLNLTGLDLSQNLLLTDLVSFGCPELDYLNISQNISLEYLHCSSAKFTSLDVSQNVNLRELHCQYGQLTYVDVSNNSFLTHFDCSGELLEFVDVTQNPDLIDLDCSLGYKLTSIDLSQNTNLINLGIGHTGLTEIDLSQNINLEVLSCSSSYLQSLDFSNNPNFRWFNGSFYELTSLDFSQNPNLEGLTVRSIQLTELNLQNGNNDILDYFWITNNPLLDCVLVDNVEDAYNYPSWNRDPHTHYSEDCTLGIGDMVNSEIVLYPNPVTETLFIDSKDQIIESLKIINLQGRIIKEDFFTNKINLSHLDSGMYFIQISLNGNSTTKKFIKK